MAKEASTDTYATQLSIPLSSVRLCPVCRGSGRVRIGRPLAPRVQLYPAGLLSLNKSGLRDRDLYECVSCRVRFFETVAEPTALADLYGADSEAEWFSSETSALLLLEQVRALVPELVQRDDLTLLDVGCFSGNFLAVLPKNWTLWGIEPSPAAGRAQARVPTAEIVRAPLESAEIPSGFFDIVTAFDVVEHVLDAHAFFERARRALRPGGALVIHTGDCDSRYARATGLSWYYYSLVDHSVFYGRRTFGRIVTDFRFALDSIRRAPHLPTKSMPARARDSVLAAGLAIMTVQGRYKVPYYAALKALDLNGTLPPAPIADHFIAVARRT
jgi:SAM-dependent methyltransferase